MSQKKLGECTTRSPSKISLDVGHLCEKKIFSIHVNPPKNVGAQIRFVYFTLTPTKNPGVQDHERACGSLEVIQFFHFVFFFFHKESFFKAVVSENGILDLSQSSEGKKMYFSSYCTGQFI